MMYSIGEAGFQEFLIGHIWRDFRCERVDVYPVGALGLADRRLAGPGCCSASALTHGFSCSCLHLKKQESIIRLAGLGDAASAFV